MSRTPQPPPAVSTATPPRSHPLVRAARIVAAWTAFGIVMAQSTALDVRMRGTQRGWVSIVGGSMLGAWIWALCTPAVMAWARRLRPLRAHGWRGWLVFLAGHLALAVAVTGVDAVLYHYIRPLVDDVRSTIPRVFAAVLLLDLALYAIVAAIAEALEYARRARELERTLDEVRLHALEAQLRPHFLYNTLNLIAELVHDEPDAADAMLTRLGFLLRRSYGETPHLVPLGQELEIVRAYADILARRYRDRVALHVDVPATLHDQLVPVFSLQPLVENAFRHGVERREGATAVEVSGARRDGDVVLRVVDRGLGTPTPRAPRPHPARAGIGLRNTRERLAALFGGAAGLTFEQQGDVATATLSIPARTSAPAALVTDPPLGTAPSAAAASIAALASRG